MLDLSDIRVVDNHCHPVLLKQEMDALRGRSILSQVLQEMIAADEIDQETSLSSRSTGST